MRYRLALYLDEARLAGLMGVSGGGAGAADVWRGPLRVGG
jgi:hypothetical protein